MEPQEPPPTPHPPAAEADAGRWAVVVRWYGRHQLAVRRYLELLAATTVAVAQPILDVLGNSAELFLGGRPADPVLFALVLVFGPPALLLALELVAQGIRPTVATWIHRAVLAVLLGSFLHQLLVPHTTVALAAGLSLVVAGGLVWLQARSEALGQWLRFLSPVSIVFLALFVLASDVTPIVLPGQAAEAAEVTFVAPQPIVFVVLDELPTMSLLDGTGHIDEELFPNFAALAEQSTWFRNHTTIAPSTNQSLPAIVTGNEPRVGRPPLADYYPDSLFTYLGGSYEMAVQESLTSLCPTSICDRFDGGASSLRTAFSTGADILRRRLVPSDEDQAEEDQGELLSDTAADNKAVKFHDPVRITAFTDTLTATTTARLNFIHLELPHWKWEFVASGRRYEDDDTYPRGTYSYAWGGEHAARVGRLRHLAQLQYVDVALGQWLDAMHTSGLWDDAIVIVTADHGVSFTVGASLRAPSPDTLAEIMWAPLFVKGPGLAPGTISDRPTTQLDLLPTLADMLETPLPWESDGTSLLAPSTADPARRRLLPGYGSTLPTDADGYASVDGTVEYPRVLSGRAQGSGPRDDLYLWRFGPYAELVGQAAEPLSVGDSGVLATLARSPRRSFSPDDTSYEGYITGTVDGAEVGQPLAVALNGTVVSVTEVVALGSDTAFWALLPDTRFQEGENIISLYTVSGPADDPTLARLTLTTG